VGILSAILQIIARLLGFVPDRKERDEAGARQAWEKNQSAIDADLGPSPWWMRDNSARNKNDRSG